MSRLSVGVVGLWMCVGVPLAAVASEHAWRETGRPFMRNYSARDYGAQPSNWAIVQDARGVMYFGNAEGVLEYDGSSWRQIPTPHRTVVRSLCLDGQDRVYVGEVGEIGYLAADSSGQLQYQSLLAHVPEEYREFADVWSTHATSRGIYFTTYNVLMRWFDGQMRVWRAPTRYQFSFVVRDTLYVDQREQGLMKMVGDSLLPAPGGERFAALRIFALLPYDDRHLLIGTMGEGLFLYDGRTCTPFQTQADTFLARQQLYRAARLPDGTFALATIRGGVVVLDRHGRWLRTIDKAAGLLDNFVLALAPDRQGGLWLGLFNGIARVELLSPFSLLGEDFGLQGAVVAITRHQGSLYAATSLGVFRLHPAALAPEGLTRPVFQPVVDINTQAWSFLSVGSQLLAATNEGVYLINGNRARNLGCRGAVSLHRSRLDSNLVWVGLKFGLQSLRLVHGNWREGGKIPGLGEEIRTMLEGEAGTLWLGTRSQGVLRLTWPEPVATDLLPGTLAVVRYGTAHGLPPGEISALAIGGRVLFACNRGLLRFDANAERFLPEESFASQLADSSRAINTAVEDQNGNVWLLVSLPGQGDELNALHRQHDGSYVWQRAPFLRPPRSAWWTLHPDPGGVIWTGGADGLVRYDTDLPHEVMQEYPALIRRVITHEDSVVFGGSLPQQEATAAEASAGISRASMPRPAQLRHEQNALRFEFSASSFDNEAANEFRTYLEGLDEHWSAWSRETRKDYTNLAEGKYRFRVVARNIYQQESHEAVFAFVMAPPWYRSWWAYGAYALMFIAGVGLVDRVQRRRLIRQERARAELRETRLRAEAAELRTRALEAENRRKELELQKAGELRAAYEALAQAHQHLQATQAQLIHAEKMATLGQLTAGIAHEIKNPLNFVNNFAALTVELVQELQETLAVAPADRRTATPEETNRLLQDLRELAVKINEHGRRADGIVRSMMLHAQTGGGQRELTDLNALLEETVPLVFHGMRAADDTFEAVIAQDYDGSLGPVPIVPQNLRRVFFNVLSNACQAVQQKRKTAGAGYLPRISVRTRGMGEMVAIHVRDNGNGIPAEIRDRIFEPFFTTRPTGQGAGLGLSISYDIVVHEHGGDITVASEVGEYAEIIIRLPKSGREAGTKSAAG